MQQEKFSMISLNDEPSFPQPVSHTAEIRLKAVPALAGAVTGRIPNGETGRPVQQPRLS